MRFRWVRVSVIEPLMYGAIHEHTPLNPYRGEYPRFLRPPRFEGRTESMKQYDNGELVKPGEEPTGARR